MFALHREAVHVTFHYPSVHPIDYPSYVLRIYLSIKNYGIAYLDKLEILNWI